MAKVIVMDATRSECIEAIRQNKMKKSTYGAKDYPLYECGSNMGYYVQIQEPGGLDTKLLEGSKPITKTRSYAWGRVWYKGSYLTQFTGPINVVRQELVKYLQQLTTDSHPLKTYKIKNHDSGQTFSVKAVNYTDAKMKYNMHILKDTITEDEFTTVMYGERKENGNKWSVETNNLETTKRELSGAGYKYIEHYVNKVRSSPFRYTVLYTKDSITEDAISKLVQNYLSSRKPKTKAEQDEIINFLLERNKIEKEDVQKVRSLLKIVKDAITEDAYVYPTNASTNMAASFAKLCVEKFGGKVGSKGGNKYVYIAPDKETANRAKRFLEEKYKTSLPTVEFIVADSITEDAYTKYYLRRIRDKYTFSGVRGMWDEEIASYSFKKQENPDVFISIIKRFVDFNMTKSELLSKAPGFVMSFKDSTKDSITEDAFDWDTMYKISDYIDRNEDKVERMSAKQIFDFVKKQFSNISNTKIAESLEYVYQGSRLKFAQFKDSLTEDADIAQNDIKSSYLPEDANADNIQYLGFNEKRKLSFYGYGDRYFVHYDLEGRTEEIDKATVQKILKKNILGEIDENDLINKEPQAEEIVSDSFNWKKQEGDDR